MGGMLYVQVPPADVIDYLIVSHEGTVSPLKGGEDIQVHLGLLAVVHGESFLQQAT